MPQTINGVNAANVASPVVGLGGTSRSTTANFDPSKIIPLTAPPQGMTGGMSMSPELKGSSYTANAGLANTGRNIANQVAPIPDASGVITGRPGANPVGAQGPQMTAEQMRDPANAAMAGFGYAASQDRPASPSTAAGYTPAPTRQPPVDPLQGKVIGSIGRIGGPEGPKKVIGSIGRVGGPQGPKPQVADPMSFIRPFQNMWGS